MRRILLVTLLALSAVASAHAIPFWYGQEEVNAVLKKAFGTAEVNLDQFLQLDLSLIESDRDAKILSLVLHDLKKPLEATLDGQAEAIRTKEADVERYFAILYTKEIHDELWLQTRPAKQAAYKKALTEIRAMWDEHRPLAAKVARIQAIYDTLKAISHEFKEVKP